MAIEQQLIDGRYTVIERIGRGAMGVVFKCHDQVLDRLVALKQLNADLDEDPHLRKRFIQEARAAARLNHRNIITIYALHEADTGSAMVMELLEGVDLATLLKGPEALPLEVKLNIMAQVCDGLDYAHKRGIIHRDVKPANLHVSPDGLVKILDFGIARVAASRMTSSGGLIGTPDYMSPEQAAAGEIDARSDLFAVGAVLYELLAGAKPFQADSITALLMKIVHEPHVPLRERSQQLPVGASELVERLLAKDRNQRPSSAREVHDALLAISTEHPVLASSTVAVLANAVTGRISTPIPPAPAVSNAAAPVPRAAVKDDSSSKLASLAIERGRGLREAGDLAGAMRVFRSVLELAPGNDDAMREMEELEHAIAKMTGSGPAATNTAPAQPRVASRASPLPGAFPFRVPRWGIVAAAVIALIGLGSAGVYLRFSPDRIANKGRDADAQDASSQASDQPASTSSKLEGAPPIASPPAIPATPSVATPPSSPPARPPVSAAPPAPAPPVRPPPPPATDGAIRRTPSPSTAAANDTRSKESSAAEPTSTAPVPATPPAAPGPPPVSTPVAAPRPAPVASTSASALTVHHFHARSLRRGFARGSCDGNLQLLPDGFHFKTTSSADGRTDDKKITLTDIEDFEIDGNRIRIETEEQAWEFGAPAHILDLIQRHIKANKKEK